MDRPTEWSNRVTHVFRLEDGEWRLVHRHGNRLEPQYKPASRLEPPGEGGAGGSPSPVPS